MFQIPKRESVDEKAEHYDADIAICSREIRRLKEKCLDFEQKLNKFGSGQLQADLLQLVEKYRITNLGPRV